MPCYSWGLKRQHSRGNWDHVITGKAGAEEDANSSAVASQRTTDAWDWLDTFSGAVEFFFKLMCRINWPAEKQSGCFLMPATGLLVWNDQFAGKKSNFTTLIYKTVYCQFRYQCLVMSQSFSIWAENKTLTNSSFKKWIVSGLQKWDGNSIANSTEYHHWFCVCV